MWSILAEISLCLWDTVSPSKDILLDAKAANISWASESLLFVAWYKLSKLIFADKISQKTVQRATILTFEVFENDVEQMSIFDKETNDTVGCVILW